MVHSSLGWGATTCLMSHTSLSSLWLERAYPSHGHPCSSYSTSRVRLRVGGGAGVAPNGFEWFGALTCAASLVLQVIAASEGQCKCGLRVRCSSFSSPAESVDLVTAPSAVYPWPRLLGCQLIWARLLELPPTRGGDCILRVVNLRGGRSTPIQNVVIPSV